MTQLTLFECGPLFDEPDVDKPDPAHVRLCHAFEANLRQRGIPCVAVHEAQRAIFGASDLEAFDFIRYSENGPNLLVCLVHEPHGQTPKQIDMMTQWRGIFGDAFRPVFFWRVADHWEGEGLPNEPIPPSDDGDSPPTAG